MRATTIKAKARRKKEDEIYLIMIKERKVNQKRKQCGHGHQKNVVTIKGKIGKNGKFEINKYINIEKKSRYE